MNPSPSNPIVIIPARMASSRLPGKPLAEIHGHPMIVHVWRRATEAGIGPVVVACEDAEIAEVVRLAGGRAEVSGSHHASGSDRIFEVVERIDPVGAYDAVVNLQGDMPAMDPVALAAVLEPLADPRVSIATLISPIAHEYELDDPHVVKAALLRPLRPDETIADAAGFARDPALLPQGPMFHHVGVYAYRRPALAAFVKLGPSAREREFGLEQLRAMDAGMVIGARLVDTFPLGVDTPADLDRARAAMAPKPPEHLKKTEF